MPYPTVTDADFNAAITISGNGITNAISPYECAMPGPAHALALYIESQRPDISLVEFEAWPLYDQDAQAANPFKQSAKVPAYLMTAKSNGLVYDQTGQYSPTLAGPLLRYAQMFHEDVFMRLFNEWYPVQS